MTEQKTDQQNQLSSMLQQLLPGLQQQQMQPQPMMQQPMMQQPMMQQPMMQPMATTQMMPNAPQAVLVPAVVMLPDGSEITVQLQFGQDIASNPQMLPMALMAIAQQWQLKTYQPNRNFGGGWNNNNWNNNNGGWNNRRSFRRY